MKYIGVVAVILFLISGSAEAQDGQSIFDKQCKACHTIGAGKKVGPDLNGVTKKRSFDWLAKFITSSKTLIDAGDKEAVAIFEEFGKKPMPSNNLSPAEIIALLNYINSGKKSEAGTSKAADSIPYFVPSAETGRELFTGKIPLANGGPSCISCHSIRDNGVSSGGTLAIDLSYSYAEGIIESMITTIPAMISSYKTHEVTFPEKRHLDIFLKTAKENQIYASAKQSDSFLFLGGIIVFMLLLFISGIFWRHTKKKGVKDEIFRRQITSQ